jgi:hypothetical protein
VERNVAMVEAAITEIGADAEGAPHMAAMHACKRHGRARSTDDGMGLRDSGRDTIKGERKRSEEQRRSDENLFHESSSMIVTLIPRPWDHSTPMFSGKFSSRGGSPIREGRFLNQRVGGAVPKIQTFEKFVTTACRLAGCAAHVVVCACVKQR